MNTRKVHTKIWRDAWFINLSRAGKILFLYLITNEYIGFSGYVEIPDQIISIQTGLNSSELEEAKKELYPKITFFENWIYVVNLLQHDPIKGNETNSVWKPYQKELDSIPEHIKEKLYPPLGGGTPPVDGGKGKEMERQGDRDRGVIGEEEKGGGKPIKKFLQHFNSISGKNYQATDSRQEKLKKRLEKYSMAEIQTATEALLKSPFHTGENDRNAWYATPDFLLRNDEQIDTWLNAQVPDRDGKKRIMPDQKALEIMGLK